MDNFKSLFIILIIVLSSQSFFSQILVDKNNEKQVKHLTQSSDLIIVGKVVSKKSFWNDDKSRIFTNVSIEAKEYLKGKSSPNVTIKVPGGEIGEIGELYTHMPKFDDNEEMILFTKRNKKNQLIVTGGELGKIRLIKDEKTGKKFTPSRKSVEEFKNEIRLYSEK